MPSLRGSVVALVISAGAVLVLVGANAGMLGTSWFDRTAGQPVPVDNSDTRHTPASPPVVAQPPAAMDPPVAAAPELPHDPPAAETHTAPIREQPVTQVADYHPPVIRRPDPVAHQPVVAEPAPSQPPAAALPHRSSTSRTVNTEPCDCDGHARWVRTHWDPPEY